MTFTEWVRRPWLHRRRSREAKELAGNPLREFVYLDEVSVYSLVASRKGPIATDYRDTTSTLLRSELGAAGGANVGLAKTDVSSKLETSQSNELQVVRKAVIQSTFRELYQSEKDKLALKVTDRAQAPAQPHHLDGLREAISTRDHDGSWVIDPSSLTRGKMIEVDVELRADKVFGFSTAVAAMVDMVQGNSALASSIDEQDLREVVDINRILQRLLVGLVPLQGRAIHYRSVVVDGREWLVHEHLLENVPADDLQSSPVFVVGVADQQLFWKDIRRVLFSRSRYRVLARLGRDGVQADWSPVKSLGVLEDTIPGVALPIARAIRTLPTVMTAADEGTSGVPVAAGQMLQTLIRYGEAIADRYGREYHDAAGDLVSSGAIDVAGLGDLKGFESRREAFSAIANHVVTRFGIDLDPVWAAELRKELQSEAGLWPPTASTAALFSDTATGATTIDASGETPRYLDAEIVAVYW